MELRELLGRDVDVATERGIKPRIRERVLKEAVRDARERLQDIFDVIAQIERYATRGREAFKADQLLQSWFVRHLQIIGEAARLLPQEVCARNTVVSNHGIPGPAAINAVLNFLSSPPVIRE
jgi:hypothetical protein